MKDIYRRERARFDSHGDDVGVLGEERAKGDPVEVGDHLIRALAGEIGVQIGPARGDETLHVAPRAARKPTTESSMTRHLSEGKPIFSRAKL